MIQMENIYYVYIHTRNDTGVPFYVGKGHSNRAWSHYRSNPHWKYIVNKHGFDVIISQGNMSEEDAFLLEMWLIAKFRHEGHILVNMTDGGEGCRMPQPNLRKSVVCSNGMEFESVNEAAAWAGVGGSKISSVLNGRRLTAGGFTWWLRGGQEKEYVSPSSRMGSAKKRKIYRSDGVVFSSMTLGAESVNGSVANITKCATGEIQSAYGYGWSYTCVPDHPEPRYSRAAASIGTPIICVETGELHLSAQHAARWIIDGGRPSADGWPIVCCAKGRSKSAYGYTWRYP